MCVDTCGFAEVGPLVGSARVPVCPWIEVVPVCPCARGSGLCPCARVPVDPVVPGCPWIRLCPGARVPGPATGPEVQK